MNMPLLIDTDLGTDPDEARIAASGPAGALLVAQTRRFVEFVARSGLPGVGRGHIPHDPVALLTREHPELFVVEPCRVDVVRSGPDGGRVRATPDPSSPTRVLRDLQPEVVRTVVVEPLVG
jgi:inosine-uridine nucleoside N-ribohydrolase